MKPYNFLAEKFTHTLSDIDLSFNWVNRDGAPRDECFMSTINQPYTYGSGRGERTYVPIPYSDLINKIRLDLFKLTGINYEACFANKYTDKQKHLGWHADDSDSIDHTTGIAVISFGAERELWIRANDTLDVVDKVLLPNGSIFMMQGGMQSTHQHRIPKSSKECGTRISLTFRKLK